MSWDPPLANPGAPLEAYNVYRVVDGVRAQIGSVDPAVTAFVDSDVESNGNSTYIYFVTSESANGESIPSNLASKYPYCYDIIILNPPQIRWICILPPGLRIDLQQ
ncbi:MAG: hypothetical protein WC876_08420 [Candidatus Thermoplasmatota archaeon]